jgi:hypothetical protein
LFSLLEETQAVRNAKQLCAAALAEEEGRILLVRDGEGWRIPSVALTAGVSDHQALGSLFDQLGSRLELSFLYSIFDEPNDQRTYLVYRGNLERPLPAGDAARTFAPEEIPWDRLGPEPMRTVLRRYVKERAEGRFGIYVGSEAGGHVAMIEGAPLPWWTVEPTL